MNIDVDIVPAGPLGANCVFLSCGKELFLFDPGGDAEKLENIIDNNGFKLEKIFCTHGHFDHVGAVEQLKEKYNVPVYINEKDAALMSSNSDVTKAYGLPPARRAFATDFISNGDTFLLGGHEISVIGTPGHTKGGVCYYIPSIDMLIAGDTLFKLAVGRTDFPGGSFEEIKNSIQKSLYTLPGNTEVIPGHEGVTTIAFEKENNPYVKG